MDRTIDPDLMAAVERFEAEAGSLHIPLASRVRSTIPGFPWIGTVIAIESEDYPAFPYRVRWENQTLENCTAGELEVLSGVAA